MFWGHLYQKNCKKWPFFDDNFLRLNEVQTHYAHCMTAMSARTWFFSKPLHNLPQNTKRLSWKGFYGIWLWISQKWRGDKIFRIFSNFRWILPKKTETWAPLTSEVYFDSIYMNYSHWAFRKSPAQRFLTNLTQIFFKYEKRTRHKIWGEAGIFFGEKKNLETRKIDLEKICCIETVNNYTVFDFYEIVFWYRSKFCLRIFFFIKIFSN